MFEYLITYEYIRSDTTICRETSGYKLNFKIDSCKNLKFFLEDLESKGYENPIILFMKLLNE